VKLDSFLCVELYRNIRAFGRVTIREKFLTLAIGVVTEIK
jgi:translation elongation factor EF-1alpha